MYNILINRTINPQSIYLTPMEWCKLIEEEFKESRGDKINNFQCPVCTSDNITIDQDNEDYYNCENCGFEGEIEDSKVGYRIGTMYNNFVRSHFVNSRDKSSTEKYRQMHIEN